MVIPPAAKTMAFGGVATGNMNAYEHVTAVAIVRYSGCRFKLLDYRNS